MKKTIIAGILAMTINAAIADSAGVSFYTGAMLGRVDLAANWRAGDRSALDMLVGAEYRSSGMGFQPRAEIRRLLWGNDVGSFGRLDGWSIGAGLSADIMPVTGMTPYFLVQSRDLAGLRSTGYSLGLDYRLTKDATWRIEYQRAGKMTGSAAALGLRQSIEPDVFSMGVVWK